MDCELHYKIRRKNLAKKAKITGSDSLVFFGDSITEICKLDRYIKYPYFNAGISCDYTEGLLNRIEDNVLIIKPKNVILLVGINDLGTYQRKPAEIAYTYEKILQKLYKNNINVITISVLPVSVDIDVDNKDINYLNSLIKDLADKYKFIYVDIYNELIDTNGYAKKGYLRDGLHPNAKGYRLMFSILNQYINKLFK